MTTTTDPPILEIADAPRVLETHDTVFTPIVLMTTDEARTIVNRIKARLDEARRDLLDLYEREGWRALGYATWRDCAAAEFGQSTATLYRQLEAAEIERDVRSFSQLEKNEQPIPTQQLHAVKQLAPADRGRAFDRAAELAGDGKRTAAHVAQAAAEIAPLPPLPADLTADWTRYQDSGTIVMTTIYGFKLAGDDPQALETEARALSRPLVELRDHGWRVFYDPGSVGRADLHAYTASHQAYEAVAAHDIPRLALAAWRQRNAADFPDLED